MPLLRLCRPNHRQGDAKARSFVDTPEFRAVSLDPSADPEIRRCLVRAAHDAYCGNRRSAFLNTLCAAWIAEDRNQPSDAVALRLRAAGHLEGSRITSIDTRLLLLDVLRRASSWEAAKALAAELAAEELGYPFAEIVTFHRRKIKRKDSGRYTIAQALAGKREPINSELDSQMLEALTRHIKIIGEDDD